MIINLTVEHILMSTYINPFLSSFALQYLATSMTELKKDKFSYIRDLSGVTPIKVHQDYFRSMVNKSNDASTISVQIQSFITFISL
jgi:hypothetical protein